ncbi:MAG: GNAT family N-acetyltransferase [Bacilli bacterium]|nr:GNAT family N-acetyltransferase [Bacilli bacterium]
MVHSLKKEEYWKVEKLFGDWPFPYWPLCLNQKIRIYVDDPVSPKSAIGCLGGWYYCAGKPNKALIIRKQKEWFGLFPQNKEWERLIKQCFPEAGKDTRFALKHDANFDRDKLQAMVDALPEGYELKFIDSKTYDLCKKVEDEELEDLIGWFDSKKQFLEHGIGYAVVKDGKVVGGASAAYRFPKAIDIEVDVDKRHRRKGLASAASAKLILDCLDRGWKPTWDAANVKSVHLSEKLGYTFDHKYHCYWISPIFFKTVKNPDKSKWESYCGKYETNCKDFKLKEVWMKDGDLYGLASNEVSRNFKFKFYPIGENVFGRRDGAAKVAFGEGFYTVDGIVCKKL